MVQQQPTTNYIKLNHDEIEYNPNLNQIPIIPDNNLNHNKNETQHYGSYYNPNTILNNNFNNNNSHLNEQQISVGNDNNYIPPNLNNLQNLQNNGGNNYNNNNYINNNRTNYGPTNNFNTKNIQVQQQPPSFYYQPTTTTPHVTHNVTTLQQANHVTTNTTNTNANTNANTTLHIITHYDQDFHKKKNDDQAMLLFIFGFFIPICWIFLFFMTRNELKYSKKGKIYGTIGCIFWLIFLFITISFIILIIVLKFVLWNV